MEKVSLGVNTLIFWTIMTTAVLTFYLPPPLGGGDVENAKYCNITFDQTSDCKPHTPLLKTTSFSLR